MTSKEIALQAAGILDDKKAQDVVIIDIAEKSSFADYFVIASGNSERQISSLQDELDEKLAREGVVTKSVEGRGSTGWILMDYGDVIINLFTQEQRERYNIEKIWGDCPFITVEE